MFWCACVFSFPTGGGSTTSAIVRLVKTKSYASGDVPKSERNCAFFLAGWKVGYTGDGPTPGRLRLALQVTKWAYKMFGYQRPVFYIENTGMLNVRDQRFVDILSCADVVACYGNPNDRRVGPCLLHHYPYPAKHSGNPVPV